MDERQFSLAEAARALRISERTARRWIQSGKLRAYKPGRDYRIPESALRELEIESAVRPKAEASPSQDRLFNGAREREAFIDRVRRYVEARVSHYTRRLRELEDGPLSVYDEAKRLFDDAMDEFIELPEFVGELMADRWMMDPDIPEDVKEEFGRAVGDSMLPLVDIVGRISGREKELAETAEEQREADRRRAQMIEQSRTMSA